LRTQFVRLTLQRCQLHVPLVQLAPQAFQFSAELAPATIAVISSRGLLPTQGGELHLSLLSACHSLSKPNLGLARSIQRHGEP